MKKPRRCGVVAAVVALVLLACLQIQYHHLKVVVFLVTSYCSSPRCSTPRRRHYIYLSISMLNHWSFQVDLGKAGFASGTTQDNRWGTRRIATGTRGLPRGILQPHSDMDLRPLYSDAATHNHNREAPCFLLPLHSPPLYAQNKNYDRTALLAMAVGISQIKNVDTMARKFLNENYAVMLFHYDGNVDGWHHLEWSHKAIHILAHNQTKWWFAKRFLHPDVMSIYDFIFLWDEDLGLDNFNPRRYLDIMVSEGLEITQPALDPDLSTDIHHRITIRNKMTKVHRRIYDNRPSMNCSDESKGPPCTGWVEGMAPVFSRAAWKCVWHLIQNDLIHGWGLDMKLGYCAQGDRTEKVGVIDNTTAVIRFEDPCEYDL
ncbi:hypothetical protein PR202_ga14280 [Eleusine coracana subsp. coracana]|uniref:Lysine ketoglutarate reductase trans-splicing-like protein n=1 Tax=Eleusine coracana subsp. coracana TaxID=191504 RepID=A0AAV5CH20_ELECO|nr:hypothetical protein PR202_ga14280 [Eleusine coracana subsp. coracana]